MTIATRKQQCLLAAALTLVTSEAVAADQTVSTALTTSNGGLTLSSGDTLTISSTGSIVVGAQQAVVGSLNNFSLTNNGTLNADNPGGILGFPFATEGVELTGNNNTVTNNGSLISSNFDALQIFGDSAAAVNTGTISGGEDGIYLSGNTTSITNSGTVTSTEDGLEIDGSNGVIANTGTVTAGRVGLFSTSTSAKVTNSGTITATADGIFNGAADGQITNSGTITAGIDGIYSTADRAQITNSGTINSTDDGIDTSGDNDVIVNSGTINATRDGIEADGANVVITNSGTVISGSDAFDLNGADATLNLEFGSVIQGELSFDGANSTLNIGAGLNAALTTDGGNPTTINAAGGAMLQDGNTIYTLNLDQGFAGIEHMAGLASGLHALTNASRSSSNTAVTRSVVEAQGQPWAALSLEYSRSSSNGSSAGYSARSGELVSGLDLTDGLGLFIGANTATLSRASSFNTSSDTVLGGLYGSFELGSASMNWSLAAGRADTTARRTVTNSSVAGGLETATGRYNQTFVNPAVSYSADLGDGQFFDLELGYIRINTPAFTETGATANATYAARSTDVATFTPKITWTEESTPLPFDLTAGVQLRKYWGNPINVTLGAATGNFVDINSDIQAHGFLSATLNRELSSGWSVFGEAKASVSSHDHLGLGADLMFRRDF